MITSLVQLRGSIPPESAAAMDAAAATSFVGASTLATASACDGTPVSATQPAPAAPTNNSRREILFPMFVLTPRDKILVADTQNAADCTPFEQLPRKRCQFLRVSPFIFSRF
jgi:hypothetical protein